MPKKSKVITVGLIQAKAHKEPAKNLSLTLAKAEKAAKDGAQIICTQELFSTEYFCQSEDHSKFDLAEPIPGPTTKAFQNLAQRYKIVLIVSIFEKRGSGVYHNSAAIINTDGAILGIYRKMHIPDDPLYYEKFYFTPGDLGFRSWKTPFGKIGVLICWDQWYPEAARLTAMQGAEILFYPTAIGWHPSEKAKYGKSQHNSWETIQRSHAIANGCYVATVNRVGHEETTDNGDGIEFWGQSFISDTSGELLRKADLDETTLLCDLDLGKVDTARTHWPFLRDRRIDAYSDITKRLVDE
ncbi:MAG: acyltransferase [Verrucomicrobiales bacterium]|nr:acyltransferase [Verrucomicrobiales bacterium]|tara:strand:- start:3172 stop:4065 length:894 start_codon:yes stop_codon:yes gene_type:complete